MNQANAVDRRYDEGYFHGVGSGYKKEGYENEHADWRGLIQWVGACFSKPIVWLDAGCAYGYLIEQAASLGVEAYGVDISSYALRQNRKARGKLAQALVYELPFQKGAFDVASLFDLIEHLEDPNALMGAVESVLKPDGVLFLSTPDPIYFHRKESTHINEHPPSCWAAWLKDRGWMTAIRFGGQPYELEIAACRESSETWRRIQREFQSQRWPLVNRVIQTGGDYSICLRSADASDSLHGTVCLYLLNSSKNPKRFSFSLVSGDERHPDLFAGDLKLRYQGHQKTEEGVLHEWSAVPLPPGGYDVTFRVDGEPIPLVRLSLDAREMNPRQFLEELPFDHYQRYQSIAAILDRIGEESLTVLDAGGALGYLHLFAPRHHVTVIDRTWEDWPGSLKYSESTIPFSDRSFDVVTAVDTLEHVPAPERASFIRELCRLARKAVLVCGPFNDPDVAESEAVLREFLTHHMGRKDRFLEEHFQNGLPNRDETAWLFRSQSFSPIDFANGYLPRWLSMQIATFALTGAPELAEGARNLNSLYNRNYYETDNKLPCYRTIFAAFRETIPESLHAMRGRPYAGDAAGNMWPIADLIVSLTMLGVLREKDSYLSDQGKRLERFLDHLKNLEKSLQEGQKHAANLEEYLGKQAIRFDNLQKHGENLAKMLDEQKQERQNLQNHGDNLAKLLEEQKQERANLQTLISEAQKRNEELTKHGSNLESLLQSIQQHASNLEVLLNENQKHTRNLESLLQTQESVMQNKEEQFMKMIARLGLGSAANFQDGIPHLESRIQILKNEKKHLADVNNDLTQTLKRVSESRLYHLLRNLGWNPIGRGTKK